MRTISLNIFYQFFLLIILGSVLDTAINGYPTSGRHASLMASSRSGGGENSLREGLLMSGTLTGQKVNYLDSGYSEEDPSEQANVTSCLVKTSSGSIYIPPSKYLQMVMMIVSKLFYVNMKNAFYFSSITLKFDIFRYAKK